MASYVVDASVSMAWFLEDQASPFTDAILMKLPDEDLWVPSLWILECVNVLTVAQRRSKITLTKKRELLTAAEALPLRIDATPPVLLQVARLAEDHDLTSCDATYLALALRTGYPLVTRDRRLAVAARSMMHPVETDEDR